MRIVFRSYTKKDGSPNGGYAEILEYLNGLTEKDNVVRIDYDKKNEFGFDEVDFFFPTLKISKLNITPFGGRKFEATFETKVPRSVFALFVTLAGTGNCGHSYEVAIGKKSFSIDGDGADYVESINGVKLRGDILDNRTKWPEIYNKKECKNNLVEITETQLIKLVKESVNEMLNTTSAYNAGTICIDFDGTVVTHEYPDIGKDIGAVPVLKKLIENGNRLILYTMRSHKPTVSQRRGIKIDPLQEAIDWFDTNDIPLFGVNSHPGQERWTDSPKVHADLTIDDRNVGCPVRTMNGHKFVDWDAVENWLIDNGFIREDS